jgi:NAD-dependent dihydropyrimidine dehydrogenase PreA subunit
MPQPIHYSGPKGDLVYSPDDCYDCSGCVGACPFSALEIRNGLVIADMERCTLCTICERVCPTAAFDIVRAGKSGVAAD